MKITITQEFETVEDAQAFLAKVVGGVYSAPAAVAGGTDTASSESGTVPPHWRGADLMVKKPRKPRADAGQPRGPHKSTGDVTGGAPSGAAAPAAPSDAVTSPTNAAAAGKSPADADNASPSGVTTAPAAAAPAKKLTHDDMRAELGRINKIAGLGMAACQQFIGDYRTEKGDAIRRITEVPEAEFPRFVAQIDARIARFQAEGK